MVQGRTGNLKLFFDSEIDMTIPLHYDQSEKSGFYSTRRRVGKYFFYSIQFDGLKYIYIVTQSSQLI